MFLQGCNRKCEGCHNPSTWDIKKGKKFDLEDIVKELVKNCLNKKLTISGGEPLLQYPAILELAKTLKFFDITLYTGFDLEEVPKEILQYINYIKVGHFVKDQRSTIIPYTGSKNQKFINLKGEINEIH